MFNVYARLAGFSGSSTWKRSYKNFTAACEYADKMTGCGVYYVVLDNSGAVLYSAR